MACPRALNICVLAASSAVVAGLGCTVTYQSLYENDIRFEHCYRLDEERSVPIAQKRACWQAWTRSYTYGQSRDRIEYARARDRTLAAAEVAGVGAPPGVDAGAIACPMPTSAFAPPPATLARDAGAPSEPPPSQSALIGKPPDRALAAAPGAHCGDTCGRGWVQCGETCKDPKCHGGCDEHYRTCMRSCF
jgi:hypothetical protein